MMTKIRPKQWVILQWRKVRHRGELLSAAVPVQLHWNQCGCVATSEDSLWHSVPRGQSHKQNSYITACHYLTISLNNIWKMILSESNEPLTQEMPVFISECLLCVCPHRCAHELSVQLHTYMFLTLVDYWVSHEHFLYKSKGNNI